MKYLVKGRFEAGESDLQYYKRNRKGYYIFVTTVTEGMFLVGGFGHKLGSDQAYYGRSGVRQIVEAVRNDCRGIYKKSYDEFSRKEQDIAEDTDYACEYAVGSPVPGIFDKELFQYMCHAVTSLLNITETADIQYSTNALLLQIKKFFKKLKIVLDKQYYTLYSIIR